jgi:hypothetical protein
MNFVYDVTVLIRQAISDVAAWKLLFIHYVETKDDPYYLFFWYTFRQMRSVFIAVV